MHCPSEPPHSRSAAGRGLYRAPIDLGQIPWSGRPEAVGLFSSGGRCPRVPAAWQGQWSVRPLISVRWRLLDFFHRGGTAPPNYPRTPRSRSVAGPVERAPIALIFNSKEFYRIQQNSKEFWNIVTLATLLCPGFVLQLQIQVWRARKQILKSSKEFRRFLKNPKERS